MLLYRPVSLTLLLGKVMEQIILSAIIQHVQDNQVIRPSQHGFMKGRSCLTNLISSYEEVTHLVDEGKAVDVFYLDFHKAFDTVSHIIFLQKLAAHGFDRCSLRWVKNWWDGRAQRVVVNGVKSSWRLVTRGVPQGSLSVKIDNGTKGGSQKDWLYTEFLKRISAEKNLGVMVDNKLCMSQQCALSTVKINCILGCVSKTAGSCAKEVILLLH
ncbi:hypothetical protein QYF61_018655 [Mycteria americana]|uniref:Reverse transcriptase domain-containing protein n=1 Tax=Mycteria americana TaxID=33587 RepID=A0AAN7NIC3_MYCAM|nr:hypothetical protein QYF61_018655 [Mycteria americana]